MFGFRYNLFHGYIFWRSRQLAGGFTGFKVLYNL